MIERHWKGIAKKERAEEYIMHLKEETFMQLAAIEGFASAKILNRSVAEGIEFLIITQWQNMDVIKQFAGTNIEVAVVPERVREMMIMYDKTVQHYNINFEMKNIK